MQVTLYSYSQHIRQFEVTPPVVFGPQICGPKTVRVRQKINIYKSQVKAGISIVFSTCKLNEYDSMKRRYIYTRI